MNLADRINLYYKIGRFVEVPFTEEELVIRQQVEDCEKHLFEELIAVFSMISVKKHKRLRVKKNLS